MSRRLKMNQAAPPLPVPYPAIFEGCRFFIKHSEERNHHAVGKSGGCSKPCPERSSGETPEKSGCFTF